MTRLGLYLSKKSVNQSAIARKTGLSKSRINQLFRDDTTQLRADELYLILLAVDIDPGIGFKELYSDLKLPTTRPNADTNQ